MRKIQKITVTLFLTLVVFFATSLSCFATDSETLGTESTVETITTDAKTSSGENCVISYQTTVIDLNTGTEYHATTGNSAIVETEIGHQYSVTANATVSDVGKRIDATTHFSIGSSGLVINCEFGSRGGTRIHTYIFNLPDNAKLKYVKNSLFSNDGSYFGPTWSKAIGSNGLTTNLSRDTNLNDSFILEVIDSSQAAEEVINSNPVAKDTAPKTIFFATFLPCVITAFIVGVVAYIISTRKNRKRSQ